MDVHGDKVDPIRIRFRKVFESSVQVAMTGILDIVQSAGYSDNLQRADDRAGTFTKSKFSGYVTCDIYSEVQGSVLQLVVGVIRQGKAFAFFRHHNPVLILHRRWEFL